MFLELWLLSYFIPSSRDALAITRFKNKIKITISPWTNVHNYVKHNHIDRFWSNNQRKCHRTSSFENLFIFCSDIMIPVKLRLFWLNRSLLEFSYDYQKLRIYNKIATCLNKHFIILEALWLPIDFILIKFGYCYTGGPISTKYNFRTFLKSPSC